jgi:anaerobic selenocysteine-containing dehydrogenase
MKLTRRRFLTGAGAAAGTVAAGAALGTAADDVLAGRDDPPHSLPVDRVVRTTCSPNCTGSCGQLAFVRDGNVVKVQQAADYPDEAYNPRGCMKGISYHLLIHGPDRVQTPLVRDGERGSGRFREATWDEVLDRIADELTRIGERWGWDTVHVFSQVPGSGYIQKGAAYRACAALGMTHGTSFDFNGDLPMGMPITFGVQNAEHESKDWANSRFILLIGANPLETRIPDVHFIHDAVERGARLVVVDPTFSSTAAKADAWLQIKPGTDAALGLALARQVVADGKADWDFMRTFTDAPLLVREDTGRRLRADELAAGEARDPGPAAGVGLGEYGRLAPPVGTAPELPPTPVPPPEGTPPLANDRYVLWDEARDGPVIVGTDRLGIPEGVMAALDGVYTVRLKSGAKVRVSPGFAPVRAELMTWTPERAAEVTGVPAETIVRVARAYAAERPAAVIMGGGSNHWFHGDLTGRAFALLASLTGNVGRSGGGFSVYVGQYKVRVDTSPWWNLGDVKAHIVPSVYFVRGRTETMNETVPYPKNGWKALICTFANMFLQAMDVNRLHETLDGCELVVVVDHQMTDTAKWADIVLPAATWYEKADLTATPLHPFLQIQQEAIPPVGESKPELWMWQEIVKRIDPDLFVEHFDMTAEQAIEAILANGGPAEGITLEQLREGPVRLKVPDPDVAFIRQVEELQPFPPRSLPAPLEATAAFIPTRRAEFYKEEDRFREAGEAVPTYKPPHDDGVHDPAEYPLALLSPHSKWRIHSSYANVAWLNEITGGRAPVLLSPATADERDIADGDLVEIANRRGSVRAWAHVTPAARPGTATLFEGWWSRQLGGGKSVNELTSSEVNPIHEIHYVANMWAPSTGWKDCRCEVTRVGDGDAGGDVAGSAGDQAPASVDEEVAHV